MMPISKRTNILLAETFDVFEVRKRIDARERSLPPNDTWSAVLYSGYKPGLQKKARHCYFIVLLSVWFCSTIMILGRLILLGIVVNGRSRDKVKEVESSESVRDSHPQFGRN